MMEALEANENKNMQVFSSPFVVILATEGYSCYPITIWGSCSHLPSMNVLIRAVEEPNLVKLIV